MAFFSAVKKSDREWPAESPSVDGSLGMKMNAGV
jgi:hypothetical protein